MSAYYNVDAILTEEEARARPSVEPRNFASSAPARVAPAGGPPPPRPSTGATHGGSRRPRLPRAARARRVPGGSERARPRAGPDQRLGRRALPAAAASAACSRPPRFRRRRRCVAARLQRRRAASPSKTSFRTTAPPNSGRRPTADARSPLPLAAQLTRGATVDLPLWLVPSLYGRKMVSPRLPACFSQRRVRMSRRCRRPSPRKAPALRDPSEAFRLPPRRCHAPPRRAPPRAACEKTRRRRRWRCGCERDRPTFMISALRSAPRARASRHSLGWCARVRSIPPTLPAPADPPDPRSSVASAPAGGPSSASCRRLRAQPAALLRSALWRARIPALRRPPARLVRRALANAGVLPGRPVLGAVPLAADARAHVRVRDERRARVPAAADARGERR